MRIKDRARGRCVRAPHAGQWPQTDHGGEAMTLLHTTMLMLGASCALMLVGFSARESRWGPALMMLGIVGALLLIAYNIYEMSSVH
jgi:hypothetical protein